MADIDYPVNLAEYEATILANPHSDGDNWGLPCYAGLKKKVKEHYADLQEDKCIYCRIDVNYGGYGEPIEHIVPKADRPQWMFVPKNLALSCYPCNTKKNAKNTLAVSGLTSIDYPENSNDFLIYHPHFDEWTTHFLEFHEFFLLPRTQKGQETFEVCQLYRLDLPLNKAKKKDLQGEDFRIRVIEKALSDPSVSGKVKDQCKQISKEIIRRARNRKLILESGGKLV